MKIIFSLNVANLIIILSLSLLSGCITHWPDAPYLDESSSLDSESARVLEANHPGAKLISTVYRRHMENERGRYRMISLVYLFEDDAGRPHRAHVTEDGRLTIASVTFTDALPPALHDRFFKGSSALVPGGQLNGRVWRFSGPLAAEIVYEFEFIQRTKQGLGQLTDPETSASATYMIRDVDD